MVLVIEEGVYGLGRLEYCLEEALTSLRIEREGGDQVGRKYEQQMKDVMKVGWLEDI